MYEFENKSAPQSTQGMQLHTTHTTHTIKPIIE